METKNMNSSYSWELVCPPGMAPNVPPTRGRHTAVMDEKNHQIVIFGGQNFDLRIKYNTIAKFNVGDKEWVLDSCAEDHLLAPTPRSSHSSVSYQGGLYVFGGTTSLGLPHQCNKDNGVWRYDMASGAWAPIMFTNLDICGKRYGHTTVCIPEGIVVLFGGMTDNGPDCEAYTFDLNKRTVEKLPTTVTEPRLCAKCGGGPGVSSPHRCRSASALLNELHLYGHTAVYHHDTRGMFIFGGTGRASIYSDIFARLDLSTRQWALVQSVNSPPAGRYVHCAAIDNRDTMYLFGGFSGTYRCDLHTFSIGQNVWRELVTLAGSPCPSLRSGASVVIDHYTDSLYIFGGCDDEKYFNDVWRFRVGNTKSLVELVTEWVRDAALSGEDNAAGVRAIDTHEDKDSLETSPSHSLTSRIMKEMPASVLDVLYSVAQQTTIWK